MASGCFDLLAAEYDRAWTNSGSGRLQRNAVWRYVLPLFRAGDRILDLGCGTGEDAQQLERMGVSVSALDASPEMVRIAQHRGINAHLRLIEDIGGLPGTFDGAISNFGALNCVAHLTALRIPLARLIRSRGHLAICLMSRFCLLESWHFLRHLQFRKAVRRWPGETYAQTLGLKTYYPRAIQLQRAFHPDFRLIFRTGIGLAVPPSYMTVSSASLDLRSRIDQRIAHLRALRAMADHQLFLFVRTGDETE